MQYIPNNQLMMLPNAAQFFINTTPMLRQCYIHIVNATSMLLNGSQYYIIESQSYKTAIQMLLSNISILQHWNSMLHNTTNAFSGNLQMTHPSH